MSTFHDRLILPKKHTWIAHLILLIWVVIVLAPVFLALFNSLKPNVGEVFRSPFALPSRWAFDNYQRAWIEADFVVYFKNSLIISLTSVLLVVACASSTAFVLARQRLRYGGVILSLFLLGIVIPLRLALAPLFLIVRELGLIDTLSAVILTQSATMLPIAVYLFVTFIRQLPEELEFAAEVDGASPLQIYWYIILPSIRPAMATVALLTFVQSWNEYFLPMVFLISPEQFPITVGITQFNTQYSVQWHMLFAGILIMLAPTLIAFSLAAKQISNTLTQGAVKG